MTENIVENKIKKRFDYIDTLKFLAILAIIFLHAYKINTHIIIMHHNFYNLRAFTDFGVPLFLMVTGALALNKNIDLDTFLKKKFTRIMLPLIFYLIVSFFIGLFTNFLTFYWYSWMILGAYLAIPLVNKIIQNSSMKELEYFVGLIIFTSIFYCCSKFLNFKFAFDLNYFINPISYIVLGYYIFKKDFTKYLSANKMILLSTIAFFIISVIKMKVGLLNSIYPHYHLFSGIDLGIIAMLQAACVFLIVRYVYDEHADKFRAFRNFLQKNTLKKFFLSVIRSTYGIFFVHVIIFRAYIYPVWGLMGFKGISSFLLIFVSVFISFILSWIITYILGRIPYIKYFSGYY